MPRAGAGANPRGTSRTEAHYADLFARQIAGALQKARASGEVAGLYGAAAPNCLGALRHGVDAPAAACIVESDAGDVVREAPDGIRRHLPDRL